jgi:hypothetical protein
LFSKVVCVELELSIKNFPERYPQGLGTVVPEAEGGKLAFCS